MDLMPQTSGVPLPDHEIKWYRTPLPKSVNERVHTLSDARGFIQTLGFLGSLLGVGACSLFCAYTHRPALSVLCALLYGLIANFLINGMHELGHNSVFKTRELNGFFLRVLSFLGWLHPDMFFSSHLRHHRYTQNAPHDQENPMPIVITLWDFLLFGFVNVKGAAEILAQTLRAALGWYPTGHLGWLPGWEEVCYPPALPEARAPATRWARFLLAGHALIAAASISQGCYLLPFLLSCGPFYNGWLFFLCNATQHVGMHPGVSDFRLNTRTFYLHPVIRFFYWHMSWHTEHHMYANVPCYHLAELHEAIKHDLPPTPNGLAEVWSVIITALDKTAVDRDYKCPIVLPEKKRAEGGLKEAEITDRMKQC